MAEKPDIAALAEALESANDRLTEAKHQSSIASSAECSARNAVNELQKAFDQALASMKASADRDTDWKRSTIAREPRAA